MKLDSLFITVAIKRLRKFNAKTSGIKDDLIKRLKNEILRAKNVPMLPSLKLENISEELQENRKIFDKSELSWKYDLSLMYKKISPGFNLEKIAKFLSSLKVIEGDEEVEIGTDRPAVKGREMYKSLKIHLCQFAKDADTILFRANMETSMRNEFRYVLLRA